MSNEPQTGGSGGTCQVGAGVAEQHDGFAVVEVPAPRQRCDRGGGDWRQACGLIG